MNCYRKVIDFIYNYLWYETNRCFVCKEICMKLEIVNVGIMIGKKTNESLYDVIRL
jgi:hypothetical protein